MNKYFTNFLALSFFVVAVAQDNEESVGGCSCWY